MKRRHDKQQLKPEYDTPEWRHYLRVARATKTPVSPHLFVQREWTEEEKEQGRRIAGVIEAALFGPSFVRN